MDHTAPPAVPGPARTAKGPDVTAGAPVPDVSVVVLSKDEAQIDATLDVLAGQCAAAGAECVVVDASAGRLDWVRDRHPWVVWVRYDPPPGRPSTIPQQRNIGVRTAKGAVIAFCDAGGVPQPGWLDAISAAVLDGSCALACGPLVSTRPGVYRTMNDGPDGSTVESVPTANLAFSRRLFDRVDGFDERYAYGSDVDFAWRCADAGSRPTVVAAAVMGMDWGPWGLQRRRSWRYGRARARLLRLHPARRRRELLARPELIVYPTLVLCAAATLAALLAGMSRLSAVLVVALAAALVVLRVRQRRMDRPWLVMVGHVVYAAGFLYELARPGRDRPLVVHDPRDRGPYHDCLLPALERAGVRSRFLPEPTSSATVNVLLRPLCGLWCRARGVRVLHVHWVFPWVPSWAVRLPGARRACRAWFAGTLKLWRACGLRVVFSAHNVLPHEQVFDDDVAARRMLLDAADAVIAHDPAAVAALDAILPGVEVRVVEQGPYLLPAGDRARERARVGAADGDVVVALAGNVAAYKGFEDVLAAAATLPAGHAGRLVITVTGHCRDAALAARVEQLAARARDAGVRVVLRWGYATEQTLADTFAGADVAALPFRRVSNSGSVVLALCAPVPVACSDLPSLAALPDDAVLRHAATVDGAAAMLRGVLDADPGRLAAMRQAAARFAATRSWDECAAVTVDAYRKALAAPRRRRRPR